MPNNNCAQYLIISKILSSEAFGAGTCRKLTPCGSDVGFKYPSLVLIASSDWLANGLKNPGGLLDIIVPKMYWLNKASYAFCGPSIISITPKPILLPSSSGMQ